MGKRSSAPAPVIQSTTQAPWSYQQPHLAGLFHRADNLYRYRDPQAFFPGQTYAGFSPESEAAMQGITNRAQMGSPLNLAAKDYTMGILNQDPAIFNKVLGANLADVIPGLQSQFATKGMARSGLAREAEQAAISREAGRLMEDAAKRAPMLAREDYYDLAQLGAVGEDREEMTQQGINEAMARYLSQDPYALERQKVADYAAFIGQPVGMEQMQTGFQPQQRRNRFGSVLGGGLGGAYMGGMYGGPVGMGIGGLLGGLGGLF